jgi:hypothetical protein
MFCYHFAPNSQIIRRFGQHDQESGVHSAKTQNLSAQVSAPAESGGISRIGFHSGWLGNRETTSLPEK